MKQLAITPKLTQQIQDAVGPDVDPSGFAVFEAIMLNSKPLPRKNGTLHEGAVVTPLTLRQMADHINGGDHLPLVSDHSLMGEPKGRVFQTELSYTEGGDVELRGLFYLDQTEENLIAKLNAGSLDEVSVSFMPTQFLCSECGWDYLGLEAEWENSYDRVCGNGHHIGEDGVHANLVGLSDFIELSLVARGAADNAKIVGKSQSKLAPQLMAQFAARGFEESSLIVQASKGENTMTDNTKLIMDLANEKASVITLSAEKTQLTAQIETVKTELTAKTTELETAQADLAAVQTELATAKEESKSEEFGAAVKFMQTTLSKILVASGKEAPKEGEELTTVAELEAEIRKNTSDLTAILPVGGVSLGAAGAEDNSQSRLPASAFSNRILK